MERRMDNRLGERVAIQLAIRLTSTRPQLIGIGRLRNLSRSGALIGGCDLQLYSLVHVVLQSSGSPEKSDDVIAAYVTRLDADGAGVEWCEFAPPAVAQLLQASAALAQPPEESPLSSPASELLTSASLVSYST
jgi:hypothetical protein